MSNKRLLLVMITCLTLSGIAMAEPILMVEVSRAGDDLAIENTQIRDGYPPTQVTDEGPYMLRIANFENKTIESRAFSIDTGERDGHSPPQDERERYHTTLTFAFDNQTSHVTLYDEDLQRVESHTVQEQPPTTGTTDTGPEESTPIWLYLGAGIGIVLVTAILYLSIDLG